MNIDILEGNSFWDNPGGKREIAFKRKLWYFFSKFSCLKIMIYFKK